MTKTLSNWGPETYFFLFACWWALTPLITSDPPSGGRIMYPAYLLALALILLFYLRSRAIGLIISGLLALYFTYLILALWSDFVDSGSVRLVVHGGALIAVSIVMAIMMFLKYYMIQKKR